MRSARLARFGTALLMFVWVGLALPAPAAAQEQPPPDQTGQPSQNAEEAAPPPGYIEAFEGTARIDREGETTDVEVGMAIVPGDRIRTEAGRVAIRLADGGALHVDRYSEIDWASDLVVGLGRGRLLITIASIDNDRLSVEAPGALARFNTDGRYRLSVGGQDAVSVELTVLEGSAELVNEAGATPLLAGQRTQVVDGHAPAAAEYADASISTLERWAEEQLAGSTTPATTAASRQYLPAELDAHAQTFDRYGSWQADATYGYVWYPAVAVDWQPYSHGRWYHLPRHGWTWAAHDPWGWPTHHYGRWGLSARGSWYWIPSRRWGPAWVYWATTPTYVGWCPLGWNGRPVVNVFSYGGTRHPRGRDPWRAWSVVPAGSFGRAYDARQRVSRTVLERDRPTFVMHHVQPGFAAPRRAAQRVDRRGWEGTRGSAPARRPGSWAPARRTAPGDTGSTYGSQRAEPAGRVTDPGPTRRPSPWDRSQPESNANPYTGTRSPAGAYRTRPSEGDDTPRTPGYAVPRRAPSRDDDGAPSSGSGARAGSQGDRRTPGPSAAPADRPPSRPADRGAGHAAPRGGDSGGAGRAEGAGQRSSGGDGGRGAAPRRRP